ncbi:Lipin/Ned1/Smp2-domain-containing protein [Schizophyllum amplum]|uniref:phosphatidate phosphatase n=1 Tax=Schizophyllum amplum TaxID=97359 RepID=A0A550CT26_9AGAR|nr:Lipin/Ned1/Smp2-domain-containing protein [Auriculariopsis ampla]
MNYLRGAVNAISAPYQYYKDLPPLNPSTLTGAIDVIVIQRPTDNGDTELVCSPFHVRFGKWQVLRPGEKKVTVAVNGHAIPFNMKIGEAGEAFFVFETDDDVPTDLLTSPILEPTRAGDEKADVEPGRFGAKQDPEESREMADDGQRTPALETPSEPEPLDLDATDGTVEARARKQTPTLNLKGARLPFPRPSGLLTPSTPSSIFGIEEDQDKRVDETLKKFRRTESSQADVQYSHQMALDSEGYHAGHDRERSEDTVTEDDLEAGPSSQPFTTSSSQPFPSPPAESRRPSLSYGKSAFADRDEFEDPESQPGNEPIPFPRATSEPPPDIEEHTEIYYPRTPTQQHPHSQEYSWDWGAFPQASPMKPSFSRAGRVETGKDLGTPLTRAALQGKSRQAANADSQNDLDDVDDEEIMSKHRPHRSRSVPPLTDGPAASRQRLSIPEITTEDADEEEDVYGSGGVVRPSKRHPFGFVITMEGKRATFEISLVDDVTADAFHKLDEVDAALRFNEHGIDFERFLDDESVVHDPRLVLRWSGDQYITRTDGSPLMDALVRWRDLAFAHRRPSRPTSPMSDDDEGAKSDTEAPTLSPEDIKQAQTPTIVKSKPTSTSWAQWWRRSQSRPSASPKRVDFPVDRPVLRETASAPIDDPLIQEQQKLAKEMQPTESAPLGSPIEAPPSPPLSPESDGPSKRFAKTLRLGSDQLKALNLKPGANSITFSLSATGAIACTARIFVWDSTDLIVVSDIDGTITKSDGLGHVFAMIGRDWTHLGVAKLYTDIARNGYKIMYLTSRAIGQADATRDYLKGIRQNDYELPEGPVIMSPDRLLASLHREVIMRKPEVFKMACLRDIQRLFGEGRKPFYAGFGNRITDALSYRSVNIPSSRIFTIDTTGEVKLELLELAGYKSSYIHMTDLVDQMFPPIHRKWAPEYTDFNYWKPPIDDYPLPDLSPPSPALSARSDTSTFQRIRNFSLVSSRSPPKSSTPLPDAERDGGRSQELRQMSSFERLSSTLGFSSSSTVDAGRRSDSPMSRSSSSMTFAESEEELSDDLEANKYRRERRTSMPGSLDGFELDEGRSQRRPTWTMIC